METYHRVGCCPEDNNGDEVLGLGDGRDEDEGEPALGADHVSSSYNGSSSSDSSSSGGYDQPPRPLRRRQRVISSPRLREARGGVWLSSGRSQEPALTDRCGGTRRFYFVLPFLPALREKPVWGPGGACNEL